MRKKAFGTAILLFFITLATQAAITSGYYHVISSNGKYLTENTSSHTLVCSDLASSSYAQVWYLNVSGTNVTFKNALTDRYIKGQGSAGYQYSTDTNSTDFVIGEDESTYTFKYDPYSFYAGGLHCDAALKVVQYDVTEAKSKWTVQAATVDASDLAEQKAAAAEATTSQLTTFFTTTACTELNSAYVAMSDENLRSAMSALPTSVQDMAVKVKNNAWTTYEGWNKTEMDFRIGSYKAYSKHDRWNNIIGTGYVFGRLTNPTGISVAAGDYIQVYVGAIPSGQAVNLEVAGLYQASGTTYALKQGMNVLLMASSGNCFINYEVDNTNNGNTPYTLLSTYADVTVHIEGGTVNGYFDLTAGDDNSDWAALKTHLLTGSTVELKSNNLVFHLTTNLVKTACPTQMVELLGEWDKILNMEHSLMGLGSFDGYWNNMLSVTDMSGQDYMHASNYGTYYDVETISSIMSYADMFAGGTIWGPAHENGHIFQKYINMVGQTEVSNNLFSNVAIYNNGHLTSRAANISTTFENMRSGIFWNDRGIWERTHLYFQLYQFFHILGKKSDFYPELFKAFRADPMVHTGNTFISATDDYLKFYKKCCEVSGYDLTEFFQAYGFFVIPTLTSYTLDEGTQNAYKVEDYSNYYLTITQEEIDAAKQYVANKNLPKANIIFIEDRITAPDATYTGAPSGTKKTAFSDEFPIGQSGETGQYTTFGASCSAYKYNVRGNKVTMEGTGAVGFKVYDSTGNLRGLYNTYSFTLPDGIGSGYTIKAAGENGTDATATYDPTIGKFDSDVTDAKNAATAVTAGTQITAESQLEDGGLYLVYYVGNGASGYMKDTGSAYTGKDDSNPSQNAVYRFTDNGNGTWAVQNYVTGKYWGTPTANANTYMGSDDAGAWALNFQSNNYIAPSCNGHSLNRSGSNIHPWSEGTANVNQLKIEKVSPSMALQDEFTDKDIYVSTEAAASLQTGQWYVMFDRGANHGYLYENGANKLYNTATAPSGSATDNAKYLVRIVGWEDEYYLQTGLGNFFGDIQQSTNVPTTTTPSNKINLKKINNTDGHFYLTSEAGIVLDANNLSQGDATAVGWGSTAPTSIGGNNDWAFYPVEFVESWIPTTSEVYTINNTNSGRGAMMYAPSQSKTYVWSSGKNSQTFSTTEPNCQWVIVPTGTNNQYYLYNVGATKFAIPSGTASTASWIFSSDAVAVTLIKQSDGTFKIKTATTDTYAAVSNGYAGPIINYNDVGGNFTITKVDGNQSEAVNAALGKFIELATPATALPTEAGWYALRIKSGTYANEFAYVSSAGVTYSGRTYPLTFKSSFDLKPAVDDFTYVTHITPTENGYAWQLPNGLYFYNSANAYFPMTTANVVENVQITYDNGFKFSHNNGTKTDYAVAYFASNVYFLGESDKVANATLFDLYPIDLDAAGLTAWQVTIENGSDATQLACSRNDVVGATTVYNGGFFFLPTGTTPESGDFSMANMLGCTVDADNHTISVQYDPELSITASDIAVIQGNQTTGKGNTMQALLRIKAKPFTDFQPTQFTINLTGAANVDNVKVYYTYNDEIRASSAAPALLGTATAAEGEVTVSVEAPSVDAGTTLYYWITADVKSDATELATIDASLTSISYTNVYKTANNKEATLLDLTAQGNPDGEMRIFKAQSYPWTASHVNTKYYRIPTIINTADGGILALTDDRYSNTNDLGNHKIDVVARKSMDNGATWSEEHTIAAGDGSSDASYGYGDPAIVRTKSGKLICLMAAGKNSFSSGMLHMGYSESTDNGATWSTVKDIYSSINKNGAEITSAFTTAGKGVTFSNGRVAFAMNGKVSGTNNEFVLYSDDEGATWALSPSIYSGADESKLEIMNDNSLLVSVRRGGWNSMANRGYNRTTGDASEDGIDSWGTQGIWGDEMNANGCNADILYYNRATEGGRDVLLHTLTKNFSTYRKDLRLYASFDQGETWKEVFQIQPGYAAYSSMQKLANGDLAIIFEDGSIGNQDKMDCFAINYIVISKEMLLSEINNVKIVAGTNGEATYGTWDSSKTTWTSNAASGVEGLTLTKSDGAFDKFSSWNGHYNLAYKPAAANAASTLTLTAPEGYIIKDYSLLAAKSSTDEHTYTLTAADGTTITPAYASSATGYTALNIDNVNAKSTTISVTTTNVSKYITLADFVVTLTQEYPVKLNAVGDANYATLYLPFDVTTDGNTKAYYIPTVTSGYAHLTEVTDNEIAANTAVILINETSTEAKFTVAKNLTQQVSESANHLKGTLSAMPLDLGDTTPYYSLGKKDGAIGFYKFDKAGTTTITLGANKAYLDTTAPSGSVKGFRLSFDTETSITETSESIHNSECIMLNEAGTVFDLSGRRVNKAQKGLYILNGRKVLVK